MSVWWTEEHFNRFYSVLCWTDSAVTTMASSSQIMFLLFESFKKNFDTHGNMTTVVSQWLFLLRYHKIVTDVFLFSRFSRLCFGFSVHISHTHLCTSVLVRTLTGIITLTITAECLNITLNQNLTLKVLTTKAKPEKSEDSLCEKNTFLVFSIHSTHTLQTHSAPLSDTHLFSVSKSLLYFLMCSPPPTFISACASGLSFSYLRFLLVYFVLNLCVQFSGSISTCFLQCLMTDPYLLSRFDIQYRWWGNIWMTLLVPKSDNLLWFSFLLMIFLNNHRKWLWGLLSIPLLHKMKNSPST